MLNDFVRQANPVIEHIVGEAFWPLKDTISEFFEAIRGAADATR